MQDFVPDDHPRALSLHIRQKLEKGFEEGLVAKAGLFAHGRGEAFDYLIGEKTIDAAKKAISIASAHFLIAKHPVISVNGNVTALIPEELVQLSELSDAPLEVNLFYRTAEREGAIAKRLRKAGAKKILGLGPGRSEIKELSHKRRIVDSEGILVADCVFVPLEDGDRTEALVKMGKTVITVDLNPLSRTAQAATVSIIDNVVRSLPLFIHKIHELKSHSKKSLMKMIQEYDNKKILQESYAAILSGLQTRIKEEI